MPVPAFGEIEDDSVGVELRRGVAIDGAGGVVFELGGNELARTLSSIITADPRLRVPLQFGERNGHSVTMRFPHAVISTDQSGERD